ncbi:MAG: hypothetical protein A2836_03325 [Candidatus Taylorbacteria bacterium RIFCSPHIGHO2_01_FULL_45_63]|uniref:Uncharacterized protein n=1 Tax=Candidatus Taylorbacteria bacterium RIFCSPHIGHO2_02_FULL_45_35 TaxID=1802311 RepID=A0A1G2MSE0_9BACT|nr:MAG: hypothetical protein A2836_03325 [Candidatus Taylorbacteria bacterium RIFCSPHIGHO2_01_FULL_45_63]OHA25921.1 MAG: hypothetical protein A3D56_02445 [Candidatus Taylorbacteria bacterium RIFCSPHIGHO2_02_FULL_45_35]OHA34746.1 MAG: hypothetical protein A3A22_00750 [Candidatus Taylorbacteria bacterium RIFCSPLOWO2_01_FULL_45_34b]
MNTHNVAGNKAFWKEDKVPKTVLVIVAILIVPVFLLNIVYPEAREKKTQSTTAGTNRMKERTNVVLKVETFWRHSYLILNDSRHTAWPFAPTDLIGVADSFERRTGRKVIFWKTDSFSTSEGQQIRGIYFIHEERGAK